MLKGRKRGGEGGEGCTNRGGGKEKPEKESQMMRPLRMHLCPTRCVCFSIEFFRVKKGQREGAQSRGKGDRRTG